MCTHDGVAVKRVVGLVPYLLEYVLDRDGLASMACQQRKNPELLGRELEFLVVESRDMARRVDEQSIAIEKAGALRNRAILASADPRTNPGDELTGLEGLDDVVIGTEGKPQDQIRFLVLGREEDHGDIRVLAYALACLEAVHTRHHDVEQDELEIILRECLERSRSRQALACGKALTPQNLAEQARDGLVIVYDQYLVIIVHGRNSTFPGSVSHSHFPSLQERKEILRLCYGHRNAMSTHHRDIGTRRIARRGHERRRNEIQPLREHVP